MSRVTIPVTVTLTRNGGKVPATLAEVAKVVSQMSADNGANWTSLPDQPNTVTDIVVDSLDPGSYLVRAAEVDTQTPPLTSAWAQASFTVVAPLPALDPPVLGSPTVS